MDLREAMKARHMVRKYLDKSMPEDIVQKLNTRVKENNEKYGVAVELRITLESFGTEHKNQIMDSLEKSGYKPKIVRTVI